MMYINTKTLAQAEVLSFLELIKYGRKQVNNLVDGFPWSFSWRGIPISHETNSKYVITCTTGSLHISHGDFLVYELATGQFSTFTQDSLNREYTPAEGRAKGSISEIMQELQEIDDKISAVLNELPSATCPAIKATPEIVGKFPEVPEGNKVTTPKTKKVVPAKCGCKGPDTICAYSDLTIGFAGLVNLCVMLCRKGIVDADEVMLVLGDDGYVSRFGDKTYSVKSIFNASVKGYVDTSIEFMIEASAKGHEAQHG